MYVFAEASSRRQTTFNVLAAATSTLLAATLLTVTGGRPAAAAAANDAATTTSTAARADLAPGTYVGEGFDACSAPSNEAMQAWLASPYRAVGIYFGGANRGCTQPNLTPGWVTTQQAAGWHLIPLYVGLQASCTLSNKQYRIDNAIAGSQGRAEADNAVTQAKALGLPAGSALFFDMEAYRTDDATCRAGVLAFISAWSARLHDLGYASGFYSSMSSGVADQIASYTSTSRVRPDYLDFARWDGVATVSDSAIPAGYWSPHRRIKQYQGGHNETWGGVTINIDNDYLDIAPLPTTPFGDVNVNGWPDLVARQPSTGRLLLYPGNGTYVVGPLAIGSGWNGMNAITRSGDFDGKGFDDVIARESATGNLWLYPRASASTWGTRIRIGVGWNGMREITAFGDLNGDGDNDVLAVNASTGYLYFYAGRGTSLTAQVSLGPGWNEMDELTSIGDMDRDGFPDLLARQRSTGDLFLYPGRNLGFGSRIKVGSGWGGMRDLTGIGDFDRDGYVDLVAIQKSTNYLRRYPTRGAAFLASAQIGVGWGGLSPLL